MLLPSQVAARPAVAAVLRAGPVPPSMVPGMSEEDVAAFNDGHHQGDIDRVLEVVKAVHKATVEVWEVVRVLRAGWREVEARSGGAAAAPCTADTTRDGCEHGRDSGAVPKRRARDAAEEGRAAALAGMLRLRGLGRFRPCPKPSSSPSLSSGGEGGASVSGTEWEVVMPRARDVLRFLVVS